MNILTHIDAKIKVAFTLLAISFVTACSDTDDDEWSPYKSSASLDFTSVGYNESVITGSTSGNSKLTWVAVLTQGSEWASFSQTGAQSTASGKVGAKFAIYLETNETTSPRRGEIQIKFTDGYSKTFFFTQHNRSDNPSYDRNWGEQPAHRDGANYVYKTYYTTLSGTSRATRNYSVCFDLQKRVSHWVAYPVHRVYESPRNYEVGTSTAGRTNAWAYDDAVTEYEPSDNYNTAYRILRYELTDPVIPQNNQQYIEFTNTIRGYSRGHMLPSASRYNTWVTNAQTFYATNLMPQNGTLNGGSWGDVEMKTRDSKCTDTLFVVTGALFKNSTTATDRKNNTIAVPSHCYKLLLRTKNGNTGKSISEITSSNALISIGFLFENSASGNVPYKEAVVSVKEIEELSGFTFFQNIDPSIADAVKSQKNINDWSAF